MTAAFKSSRHAPRAVPNSKRAMNYSTTNDAIANEYLRDVCYCLRYYTTIMSALQID
jgi:hypothetical protein